MSASPPPTVATGPLAGTQSPSQIEFLWERYRSFFWVVVIAVVAALGVNYALKYYNQKALDKKWSGFAEAVELDEAYTADTPRAIYEGLTERIVKKDVASVDGAVSAADEAQKPFLLLALARKAMTDGQWDRAEAHLKDLESKYPNHSLVKQTEYPVQVRQVVKQDKPDPKNDKEPELKPAKAGSAVTLMREQIALAKGFAAPAQFQQSQLPADAKKVKFDLSNGGSFTIALWAEKAPKHVASFLELAAKDGGYWKGMAVDEIQRSTDTVTQPRSLHLGFESTRDDERSKWITTEPSKNLLDFETNDLSHFSGAVASRVGADGKSSADRFWIVADDAPRYDGERVIFGFVVEGIEAVQRVCEESMSAQEEQMGRGRPTANVRVTAVTIL
jgi:cyclophilin family peptidyl-prolyl cis-trans isomerase